MLKDVIVTTPEEFAWRKEVADTIERRQPEMQRSFMPETDGVITVVREWVVNFAR